MNSLQIFDEIRPYLFRKDIKDVIAGTGDDTFAQALDQLDNRTPQARRFTSRSLQREIKTRYDYRASECDK